jgi:hypothetical protein
VGTTELVLTLGRYAFLALLYLFVLLVLRALLAEMRAEARPAVSQAGGQDVESTRALEPGREAVTGGPAERQLPSQPLPPRLVVVQSADQGQLPVGTAFTITAVTTIGRGLHNSVPLAMDKHVSNNHALLFVRDGVIRVRDRGSTNGTHVNSVRIQDETPLDDGDRISIGTTVLRYSAQQASIALSVQSDNPE